MDAEARATRDAFVLGLFAKMEREAAEEVEARAEEALSSEDEALEEGAPAADCIYRGECFGLAKNNQGACFGHQPGKQEDYEADATRHHKISPHGSVWTLDCCGKWFGSGSLDTPEPYPAMHAGDLGCGASYKGICKAALRRGVGDGCHYTEDGADEDAPVLPARRATQRTMARLQHRFQQEDRQLTKEEYVAELCEDYTSD